MGRSRQGSWRKIIAIIAITAVYLSLQATAYANSVVIDVPPTPSMFPVEFPKYEKCIVNGTRRACYNLENTKKLLLLWNRYKLFEPLLKIAKDQQKAIEIQDKALDSYRKLHELQNKANVSLQKALAAQQEKIKRDEQRRQAAATRDTIIIIVAGVVAVGAAVVAGYALAKR